MPGWNWSRPPPGKSPPSRFWWKSSAITKRAPCAWSNRGPCHHKPPYGHGSPVWRWRSSWRTRPPRRATPARRRPRPRSSFRCAPRAACCGAAEPHTLVPLRRTAEGRLVVALHPLGALADRAVGPARVRRVRGRPRARGVVLRPPPTAVRAPNGPLVLGVHSGRREGGDFRGRHRGGVVVDATCRARVRRDLDRWLG